MLREELKNQKHLRQKRNKKGKQFVKQPKAIAKKASKFR